MNLLQVMTKKPVVLVRKESQRVLNHFDFAHIGAQLAEFEKTISFEGTKDLIGALSGRHTEVSEEASLELAGLV